MMNDVWGDDGGDSAPSSRPHTPPRVVPDAVRAIFSSSESTDDIFDSVVMLEERLLAASRRDGLVAGLEKGRADGYKLVRPKTCRKEASFYCISFFHPSL